MTARDDDLAPGDDAAARAGAGHHWDELEAARRFPAEDEWLDLPTPSDLELDGQDRAQRDGSFSERVLRARQEEVYTDNQLADLDRALPPEVLWRHVAPEPSGSFVDDTLRRIREDQRQRWAEALSRHVAPEPSPEFVDRTLAALERDRAPHASATRPRRSSSAPTWALLSAAAAALLYVALADRATAPLELHIADRVATSASYADSTTPMAAVFAAMSSAEEPHALFDAPADGEWLSSRSGALR